MNCEQEYLLTVLREHLQGEPSTPPKDNVNWKTLSTLAQNHEIGGIFFHQCKNFLPDTVKGALFAQYSATMFYYANRMEVLEELTNTLQKENIPCFLVKGTELAKYYPIPALRTMGDTDIAVQSEHRNRVHSVMLSQEFACIAKDEGREWQYEKEDMEFEIHDRLLYKEWVNLPEHETYFNNFSPFIHAGRVDDNFHFLYLLVHLRKHLLTCGAGLRQFADIAVFTRKCGGLDWNYIQGEAERLKLLDFCKAVLALNEEWFGIPAPIPADLSQAFTQEATDFILQNGVFGLHNEENAKAAAVNNRLEGKSTFAIVVRKIFPTYHAMICAPNYTFLQGRPYLLPFAWIYRWFYCLFARKLGRGITMVGQSITNEEDIARRVQMMTQWGLMNKEQKDETEI